MNTEIEHLTELENRLQEAWEYALSARDHAQIAMKQIGDLKQHLLERRIAILREAGKDKS